MTASILLAIGLFLLAAAQAAVIGRWRSALAERTEPAHGAAATLPRIAVVVPARDEEARIAAVLQDLHAQRYPRELVEVLVVDDASTDRTAAIAKGMQRTWPALQVLPSRGTGKKAAIATGVRAAGADLILLTDADVRFGPDRLRRIAEAMSATGSDMLILPVWTEGEGLIGRLQQEEQAALLGMAMGSACAGAPTLAYGANLAFRKGAFDAVGGYAGDRFASGDDLFLLRRLQQQGRPIGALFHPDALVTTPAVSGLRAFVAQRLRWAGKMSGAPAPMAVLGALALLWPWALAARIATFSLSAAMGQHGLLQVLLIAASWLLWLMPVVGLVGEARAAAGRPGHPFATVLACAAFAIYAPLLAVASMFVRPAWKGRRV
jgi:cellulose synthase/poly-beta-1,6-N-acetylglucosamine synthase-like glycosyltransferase